MYHYFEIVKCVNNRAAFFAEQLYKSMKGLGTDDSRLIRLVVTRSEVDMGEIKEAFKEEYGESLEDFISVSNLFDLFFTIRCITWHNGNVMFIIVAG